MFFSSFFILIYSTVIPIMHISAIILRNITDGPISLFLFKIKQAPYQCQYSHQGTYYIGQHFGRRYIIEKQCYQYCRNDILGYIYQIISKFFFSPLFIHHKNSLKLFLCKITDGTNIWTLLIISVVFVWYNCSFFFFL